MQHFFVDSNMIGDDEILIEGKDVNHIKNVLRMKIGEHLEVNDGNGKLYLAAIKEFNSNQVVAEIIEKKECLTELPCKIHLYQGLPKGDKMEFIVEKAVELGVHRIVPVETKRAIVKLDDKKKNKKRDKWNSLCTSAAKQSARGSIPYVDEVVSFKNAIDESCEFNHVLVPYELAEGMDTTREAIEQIKINDSVAVFIGPEGGFDSGEIELALEKGAKPISLGKRILRTETAGLTTLSILMYHIETMAVTK